MTPLFHCTVNYSLICAYFHQNDTNNITWILQFRSQLIKRAEKAIAVQNTWQTYKSQPFIVTRFIHVTLIHL